MNLKKKKSEGQPPVARSRKGNTINPIGRRGRLASSPRRKSNIVNSTLVHSRPCWAGSTLRVTYSCLCLVIDRFPQHTATTSSPFDCVGIVCWPQAGWEFGFPIRSQVCRVANDSVLIIHAGCMPLILRVGGVVGPHAKILIGYCRSNLSLHGSDDHEKHSLE